MANVKLRPWRTIAEPREDLREGKPLDASEFAVHLDMVRDGKAPAVYTDPKVFFSQTFLTKNMLELASQVVRRMNGVTTETSAIFNLATQFGGGKTHSLALLYHLASSGPKSHDWVGVSQIRTKAGNFPVARGATAVFVGTEFDSLTGRGGADGTPLRKTPWGELAWQLGGESAFNLVAKHDAEGIAPGGDVLSKVIPDGPCLILMDELMNYISRNRKNGLAAQFYNFLQNLTETVRGKSMSVMAISIPASEMEMTADDVEEYNRITKLLDRTGKALVMSAESETSEIIRRRLFDWNLDAVTSEGKILLDREAIKTCEEYAQWCVDNKKQLPGWFSVDDAKKAFESSYPFHPTVLSVFERKWRGLQKFQQTRGVLRLLALWVSKAYKSGNEKASRDPLIGLGTAPLDDTLFRSACFEQLGERNLETAITTDIAGSTNAHAIRLDAESTEEIKKINLHRKVATVIFFESNGGQLKGKDATEPEIDLCVGEPGFDIGNVRTALDALVDSCYYLTQEGRNYRFSLKENLNKRFADRKATIQDAAINDLLSKEIQRLTSRNTYGVSVYHFPERSNQIPDRPAISVIVADCGRTRENEKNTYAFIESLMRENGTSARTFKSAQIWLVAESASRMRDEALKCLTWKDIQLEADQLNYDESQVAQLRDNCKRSELDLKESIWRAYKNVIFLGKENKLKTVDLGLVNSSVSANLIDNVIGRLMQDDDIQKNISPNFLVRNWPGALVEWSTKNVRDAFFASPQFPKLLAPDTIRDTIVRGVMNGGLFAYVGKRGDGNYQPFLFEEAIGAEDIEISDDMFILTRDAAMAYRAHIRSVVEAPTPEPQKPSSNPIPPVAVSPDVKNPVPVNTGSVPVGGQMDFFSHLSWSGEIPPQMWMNFYTKVLSKHASDRNLKLKVSFEVGTEKGISKEKVEETRAALKELRLGSEDLKCD